jgi:hypothetical protein
VGRREQIPSIHINRNNPRPRRRRWRRRRGKRRGGTNSYIFLMKMFSNIFCSTTINTKTGGIIWRLSSYPFKIRLSLSLSLYLSLDGRILALDDLTESSPFTLNVVNMQPTAWELEPLSLQYPLAFSVHLHLQTSLSNISMSFTTRQLETFSCSYDAFKRNTLCAPATSPHLNGQKYGATKTSQS